jgi:hypothetical protein
LILIVTVVQVTKRKRPRAPNGIPRVVFLPECL